MRSPFIFWLVLPYPTLYPTPGSIFDFRDAYRQGVIKTSVKRNLKFHFYFEQQPEGKIMPGEKS